MKLLVIGDENRVRKYAPSLPIVNQVEVVCVQRGTANDEILRKAADADFILADAISPIDEDLIASMPNLKLIHSEGVAYNAIDLNAARAHGVTVCNCAGANAGAVAEQTILLMLACLRHALDGDAAVRAGRQIEMKESLMRGGLRELGDCTVGFIGFGAIAQATARRLANWGCKMLYNKRHPLSEQEERSFGATFASKSDIVRTCDIVSLHTPVTPETTGMVDQSFLSAMKPGSILVNTGRGELIDQDALARALENGAIAAAGLDVLAPEPVTPDNPLLNLSPAAKGALILSPHIGGVTEGTFYRAHRTAWENIARVASGEQPVNIVSR